MNDPLSFELSPLDVEMLREFNENLEAEQRFIARTKEACEWLENSRKVARKQYSERITIFEHEAAQMPIETARYINRRRTDRGGNPLASAIILMALIVGVMLVTWLSIHLGAR